MVPRRVTWVGALVGLGLALAAPAYADMLGGDLPILAGIFSTLTDSAAKAAETVGQLRRTYEETKRIAGYADDAYRTFEAFKKYNAELFSRDALQSLELAFPDVGYFRREASGAGPWARGSGELQRLVSLCLSGAAGSCTQYREAVSFADTRRALAETFGVAPEGAHDLAAVDYESAVALAAASAQEGRSTRARQVSKLLQAQCQGKDAAGLAACQAAGASAQVEALRAQADIAEQVATGNRLQSMQLQLQTSARKQAHAEAERRHALLLEGALQSSPQPTPVKTEGFSLLSPGGAR